MNSNSFRDVMKRGEDVNSLRSLLVEKLLSITSRSEAI
jgi:hypothetical protein